MCPWLITLFLCRNSSLGLSRKPLRLFIALVRWLNPLGIWLLIFSCPLRLKSLGLALPTAPYHSAEARLRWMKCWRVSQAWKITFQIASPVIPAFLWQQSVPSAIQDELSRPRTGSQVPRPAAQSLVAQCWFARGVRQVVGKGLSSKKKRGKKM